MRLSTNTIMLTGLLMMLSAGCRPEKLKLFNEIDEVEVWCGVRDIHPEKRNLHAVGALSPAGVDCLKQYIKTSRLKKQGYVLSEIYLYVNKCIIGVVEKSDGTLVGFDVTTNDASKLPVTSTHLIMANDNEKLSFSLLQAIKSAFHSPEKTVGGDKADLPN